MSRPALMTIILGFLFLINAQLTFGQESWWEFYDLAMKDIRSKNWNLAEERLKAAYRLQPEQGQKIRTYGARFIRYFPEYYLGVVHFHQGKHQEALEEFLRVQNKGLIKQGDEENAELDRLKQQAFAKLNPSTSPPSGPTVSEQYASLIDRSQKSLNSENYEEARNFANQAVSLGTNDAKAKDLLSRIELAENVDQLQNAIKKNDLQLAQRIARKVEALDANHPELGRLKQLMAKNSDQENRQQFAGLLEQAERQFAARDYGNAKKTAQQAQSVPGADSSSVPALLKRIDIRETSEALKSSVNRKDSASAESLAKKLEALDPQNSELVRWKQSQGQDTQPRADLFQETLKNANRELTRKNFAEAKRLAKEAGLLPGANQQNTQDLLKRIELAENNAILQAAINKKDWISAQRAVAKISQLDPGNQYLRDLPGVIEEGLAVVSFYSGQYKESAKLLERTVAKNSASAKARFYLGCSYAALAFLQQKTKEGSAEKDKLLENARQQFNASRRINSSFKYDQRFISPRILQIYERIQ